jgi:hypothetical protein
VLVRGSGVSWAEAGKERSTDCCDAGVRRSVGGARVLGPATTLGPDEDHSNWRRRGLDEPVAVAASTIRCT